MTTPHPLHLRAASWLARLRVLVTRRTHWVDPQTGEESVEREDWPTAWAIAGWHSYQWRWVNRYGSLACGCTRNPLTRRIVLFDLACPDHGHPDLLGSPSGEE